MNARALFLLCLVATLLLLTTGAALAQSEQAPPIGAPGRPQNRSPGGRGFLCDHRIGTARGLRQGD